MSLGRLLRRASSKASDLLTLNPGGGGGSSSKNNVCVHPAEVPPGVGEHHPGYMCLYMEKDELLGTTLILAWVPNSRIQRQDEEALRYITPESSPVRKAPRKRGRHAPAFSTLQQASPADQKRAVIPRDEEILAVAQLVRDVAHLGSPPGEGEKLSPCCLATDGTHDATQPAHSDSGIVSTISWQEEQTKSEGTEEGLDCRPGQGEDEGSLELSADDVSRDSTFDSDSDAFSSPFCLSPISEALGGGSSSVFLDNESSSTSSLDTSAHCQEGNGPAQNTRWDEQQKVFALEQICGVFRVDLGQMRSLRLFFSDEACTSGQLVVASRESQYKIFHFHHGGLDKLSEVFQQWKYCTETHLKDQQLPEEKTCMQFSIRRPKLPSSETHPEENTYKRLDVSAWLSHLNGAGQVEEEYKLHKAIFFGGIDVSIRGRVWPFMLRYYSYESTSEEREAWRVQKRSEYLEIQQKRLSMTPEEHKEFWRNVQFTVDKDVVRTDRSNQFFRGEDNPNVETMRCGLVRASEIRQESVNQFGHMELVSKIVFGAKIKVLSSPSALPFGLKQWPPGPVSTLPRTTPGLAARLEGKAGARFEHGGEGAPVPTGRGAQAHEAAALLRAGLCFQMYLRELLRLMHLRFYQHLAALGEDGLQMLFCHRWILLCFKREFPEAEALRMWEACWAHYQTDYFHLFICVAIVVIYGDEVIEQQLATDQMLLHFGNLAMHMNGELVLRKARSLLYQFRLLPRIPCSLHDLCKLCGTGMWDSGYIPAVECSGHHPESESCPYGGVVEVPSAKPGTEGKRGPKPREVFAFRK
nr:TBC1 domain family member 16 [Pelodiscus sinensis]|eukprot:XP_025038936.1 TBC1 domain family member 16 [Pelodiscus sinensis]